MIRRSIGAAAQLLLAFVAAAGIGAATPVAAQDTGTLFVTVRRPDSSALVGAFVRSDRIGSAANDSGIARLDLPARLVSVTVSHPGFEPRAFEITIIRDVAQRFELILDRRSTAAAGTLVHGPRTDRRLADEPMPVVVVGEAEMSLRQLSHPVDLRELFAGQGPIRAEGIGGVLDAVRFRSAGLRGQYTGIMIDGMPLLGSHPDAFALAQLSPFEFGQAEWIRGSTTALHGPIGSGGVVNLVSRAPDRDQVRAAVSQSSEKGGGLMFWGARRFTPEVGGTLFSEFQQQRLVDSDDDGWGEFPRAIRLAIRPRLHYDAPNGDGFTVAAGAMSEERTGGYLLGSTPGDPYRQERRTQRFDAAVTGRRLLGSAGVLRLKMAGAFRSISHRYDEVRERDRRGTLFGELHYQGDFGPTTLVAGIGYQRDALRHRDFPAFDYTHSLPNGFVSVTRQLGRGVIGTAAGRCDQHSVHGLQCMPRVDLLARPTDSIEVRAYAGLGYAAPSTLADEAELLGARTMVQVNARAERLATGGGNLRWQRNGLELSGSVGFTRVSDPVRVVPATPTDPQSPFRLLNVDEPTRITAIDLAGSYRRGTMVYGAFYGFRTGSEGVPGSPGTRRTASYMSQHTAGAHLGWRAPATVGVVVDLHARYLGSQQLSDNPFRSEAPGYGLINALVSQRSGRARLFLSAENMLDVKLANYESIVIDPPARGERLTNLPWMPLRGRVLSLGAMVEW
ncbi:MAG: TonB-dependent receptor [Gemmatimonadales bacterium]